MIEVNFEGRSQAGLCSHQNTVSALFEFQLVAIQLYLKYTGVSLLFQTQLEEKSYTVEPNLADTPEKQTPRLCGHFLRSQRLVLQSMLTEQGTLLRHR